MTTTPDDPRCERRRYWRNGTVVRIEWWCDHQILTCGPAGRGGRVLTRDFCYTHGTQIYADLGCEICRQRPAPPRR